MSAATKYYRLAPELRRSCYYVIAGMSALAVVGVIVAPKTEGKIGLALILSTMAAAATLPLTWRIAVDERGLERRRLFFTDCWLWNDLASGNIEKRFEFRLVDFARPWWRRSLELAWLGQPALREVLTKINEHYRLPPAPDLPPSIAMPNGFRKLHLEAHGVQLDSHQGSEFYLWNEVRRVRIIRAEPLRRDFCRLEVYLPETELVYELRATQGGVQPQWLLRNCENIDTFLHRYLSPGQIDVDIRGQRPAKRIDVAKRQAELQRKLRELKLMLSLFAGLLLVGVVMSCWGLDMFAGLLKGLVLALLCLVPTAPVVWMIHRELQRELARATTELREFDKGTVDLVPATEEMTPAHRHQNNPRIGSA